MYLNICPECGGKREIGDVNLPTVRRYTVCESCEPTVFRRFRRYEQFKEAAAIEAVTSGVPLSFTRPVRKAYLTPYHTAERWHKNIKKSKEDDDNKQVGLDVTLVGWVEYMAFCYGIYWVVEHFWGWGTLLAQFLSWWAMLPQV